MGTENPANGVFLIGDYRPTPDLHKRPAKDGNAAEMGVPALRFVLPRTAKSGHIGTSYRNQFPDCDYECICEEQKETEGLNFNPYFRINTRPDYQPSSHYAKSSNVSPPSQGIPSAWQCCLLAPSRVKQLPKFS